VKSTKGCNSRARKKPQRKTNGDDVRRAFKWIVTDGIFAHVRLHGNVKWKPAALVCLAIFWVWSAEPGLVEAANHAIATVAKLFGKTAVAVNSYQGLTAALVGYATQLLPALWTRLQSLMQQSGEDAWRIGKWLPLATDGSRVSVPRTQQNEERLNKPRKRRRKAKGRKNKRGRHAQRNRPRRSTKSHYDPQAVGPQMWLTLVWHIGLRLPWCWKLGPSYSSERAHVEEILRERRFPEFTLFCADAGFYGYEFWQAIIDSGHSFLIRVGGNVRLLKGLGVVRQRGDIVYCWPDQMRRKNQPPLVLRLLCFHDGCGEVYLVTNVLDDKELTAKQASLIYRRRWGIELQFRSLKQTYGRSKLRARTPDIAEIELHWSLLGLTMLQLLAVKEQTRAGEPPDKTSIAAVLRVIRSMIGDASEVRPPSASLENRLRNATTDSYQRRSKKQSRNYPRRKEEPCTGAPVILTATDDQRETARKLLARQRAA
jgi:Transposase DDE domain